MEHVDELLVSAQKSTGLQDFGDESYLEGLERVVGAYRDEAHLSSAGEQAVRSQIIRFLEQRLQVEAWYRRHPEIDDEPIEEPLIGVSLPRTGSTALAFLLAEDPTSRSLRAWEASEPCPPPATVEGPDPRIERSELAEKLQREHAPRLASLIPSTATGPRDCQILLGLDFKAPLFYALACIPSYTHWLLYEADLDSAYLYMRRVLKLLQWGGPRKPWHLESPANLQFIDSLDTAFPDARFVMTHRDPVEVVVSGANVNLEVVKMFNDEIDTHYIGELMTEYWSVGIQRAMEFRDQGGNDRFFDIDFRTMQKDPIGEVRSLYAWLGEPFTTEFEEGMKNWWAENAAKRVPNIPPDPNTFGLDLDKVRALFATYARRFPDWTARR